jgi:hypothetical protein
MSEEDHTEQVFVGELYGKITKISNNKIFTILTNGEHLIKRIFPKQKLLSVINTNSIYFRYQVFKKKDELASVMSKIETDTVAEIIHALNTDGKVRLEHPF